MDKIKRFIDCYIPTETCNLRCHYCYIAQKRKFNNKLAKFSHTLEDFRKAFSVKRLGGVCVLNFCAGGETLLSEEVLPLVKELILEGHYVMVVTNGTITKRFVEICGWDEEIKSHLFIKFSFHYLEMIRLGIMDKFFSNVKLMKENGVSFTVEVTPSDELIPHIKDLKTVCMSNLGALCHITIARDDRTGGIDVLSDLSFEEYKNIWNQFDSDMFRFKSEIFYKMRKEFCYAGDWSLYVNMDTGIIKQCYCGEAIGNIFDLSKPICYKAVGCKCSLPHCYNGHAFLTFGDIPEINSTCYADTRNRICNDGTEWLQPEMKYIMESRLEESNKQYSFVKKYSINHNYPIKRSISKLKGKLYRIKNFISK